MREILFRGNRTDNKGWVEGLLTIMWGEYHIINPSDENTAYPIDTETVCQCTGLTDKNGRKIFEGDIVAFTDTYSTESGYAEGDCFGKVVWDAEEVCFHVTERLSAESWEVLQDCYVIGNIFDNLELLREENWR